MSKPSPTEVFYVLREAAGRAQDIGSFEPTEIDGRYIFEVVGETKTYSVIGTYAQTHRFGEIIEFELRDHSVNRPVLISYTEHHPTPIRMISDLSPDELDVLLDDLMLFDKRSAA